MIGACPTQLNCNFWEVILVCETLNERWVTSGSERRITVKDFLEYYAVKYVTATDGRYDEEPLELNNRTITKGISCKVSRKESFIDAVAREGTELEAVLKELEICRFKRVASKDDKVRRSQAKRRMAGKTPCTMEEKLLTLEIYTPLKLARLNEMPDGPVDMATVSSIVVRNLTKRKAVKRGVAYRYAASESVDDSSKRRKETSPTKSQVVLEESDKIAEGADLRPHFEVEAGLLEEQCRAKAQEKMVALVDDEFKKDRSIELEKRISQLEGEKNQFEENLTREREAFQLEPEKERKAAALKLKEVRAESVAEAERFVTASATSQNNLAGKLYQLRYTKAEILAFSEGNYEVKEIMDEEEVEEMEDGLNVAEKATTDNQETIDQEIESSRLRVVDLKGLLDVEKKSSAELQRAVEARALNDLRLAFKIYKIWEAIFGQQGYDAVLLETRANYEGMTNVEMGEEMNRVYWSESMRTCWRSVEDRKKFVLMMAREEIINEDRDIASGLLKACGVVGHTVASNASILGIGVIDCSIFEILKYNCPNLLQENSVHENWL
ncbi:hypothetical protein GIB67_042888 [Kingdonia uniflora]|uniref:Uncharacterized protein n=1 Tax=Kingdonia uniflora TaxID=39325 RepID=A0A7J7LUU2_9MAGN|nr:hypothetical protein GIB67_042888 [Kingdonia uniflora]